MSERRVYPRLTTVQRPDGEIYRTLGIAYQTELMWWVPGKSDPQVVLALVQASYHPGSRRVT